VGSMRKSRLSHYKQDRLTEHFVSGSTARTAASLCSVNRKSAAFYFLRLREIIAYELEAESAGMFAGEIEVPSRRLFQSPAGQRTRATSAVSAKANAGAVQRVKFLYLACKKGRDEPPPFFRRLISSCHATISNVFSFA